MEKGELGVYIVIAVQRRYADEGKAFFAKTIEKKFMMVQHGWSPISLWEAVPNPSSG